MMETFQTLQAGSPAFPVFLGADTLEAVSLAGQEGVNSLFEYTLTLQTPEALNLVAAGVDRWDLDAFLGSPVRCRIQLAGGGVSGLGGGVREINGLIARVEALGLHDDQRRRSFRLTLRPWLHEARLNSRCRIFQNLSVADVLGEVLAAYPFEREQRLVESYVPRVLRAQYNETDFAFFCRLTEEHGINYWFEHADGRHTLVLADHMGAFREADIAYRQVRFQAAGRRSDAEHLHRLVPAHRQAPRQLTAGDHDPLRSRRELVETVLEPLPPREPPTAVRADADDGNRRDARRTFEATQFHTVAGGSRFAQAGRDQRVADDAGEDGRVYARLRLEALRSDVLRTEAAGNLRGMVPGRSCRVDPPDQLQAGAPQLILLTRLVIDDAARSSRLPGEPPGRLPGAGWKVEVELVLHPLNQPLRPAVGQPRPDAGGAQSGVVVGPRGKSVHVDAFGRVQVRLHWHSHQARDGLPTPERRCTCWLRVGSALAGNQMGAIHTPRIGQEVFVSFLNGDIDQPYVSGMAFNSHNQPPWDLPGNAALSGFRSRELGPDEAGNAALGRSNHLLFDDTEGELQAQLKSDHQHSQLGLGHIVRVEDHRGRKEARGDGFELRTDGHGVLRAACGLLVSTEARRLAAGHAKSLDETAERLDASRELQERLARSAREAGAQQPGDQDAVVQAIAAQTAGIRGTGPADAHAGRYPEIDRPHILLASAAGIGTSAAGDTHIASGGHTALASGGHTSVSSNKSFFVSVRDAIRLFAFRLGLRFVAAAGGIELVALRDGISLIAELGIRLHGDSIHINAKSEVLINGGGSYLRLNAGAVTVGTAGNFTVLSGKLEANGPHSLPVDEVAFPAPAFDWSDSENRGSDFSV